MSYSTFCNIVKHEATFISFRSEHKSITRFRKEIVAGDGVSHCLGFPVSVSRCF